MKLATATNCNRAAGFTLVEVLAALLFLAIVIPTAIEALHVATLSGEVAVAQKRGGARGRPGFEREHRDDELEQRHAERHGDRKARLDFRWTLTSQTWPQDSMQLLTAEVTVFRAGKRLFGEVEHAGRIRRRSTGR